MDTPLLATGIRGLYNETSARLEFSSTKEVLRSLIEPILVDPTMVPSDDDRPDYIDPLDGSGKENLEPGDYIDWIAAVRPESLANGLLHKLASPAGFEIVCSPWITIDGAFRSRAA